MLKPEVSRCDDLVEASSLVTQPVGDGMLVADPRSGTCHHLDETARLVLEGREADLEERHGPERGRDLARVVRTELHEAGLLEPAPTPMTRQEFLRRWGAAAALPLILTLALPGPAQAASPTGPAPTLISLVPNVGPAPGGATATLTGTGFTGATAVFFGGNPAPAFTVDSDSQITAITPAAPSGPVNVTVVTPMGTSNGLPYTYI